MDESYNIYELPVYDGRTKEWRLLNLNSGTIYSGTDATEEACDQAIEEGTKRGGGIVRAVSRTGIRRLLDDYFEKCPSCRSGKHKWKEGHFNGGFYHHGAISRKGKLCQNCVRIEFPETNQEFFDKLPEWLRKDPDLRVARGVKRS